MAAAREVVVVSGVRTAVGKYGGSLKDMPPADLGAAVVREAVSRSGVEPADVGHVVFGNVIHTETRDMYLSRVASVNGGLPVETPAFTLNRLCGSGLQAIVSAAQLVMLGDTDVALAGGSEVMSRGLYGVPAMRWGARMGETSGRRHDGRGADRPLRRLPHGGHGRERGRQVGHLPRGPGRAGRAEPPAGGQGHGRGLLQGADPPDRAQVPQGHGRLRHRRAHPGRRLHGGHGQAAPGVRQERLGDRRQRRRDQRRRRRGGAVRRRRGRAQGP